MTGKDEGISLQATVGFRFQPTTISYNEQDAALYALAIGASQDPLDSGDLQYTYELFPREFKCFPTYATTFPMKALEQIGSIPGQKLNLMEVLHGEHYLELVAPMPKSAAITTVAEVSQVYDKGSGALLVIAMISRDEDGNVVALNRASLFIRGRGNFGGDRGPSSREGLPPERPADAALQDKTNDNQALLYRLASGDLNPLHADTRFAALLGYERPILHGLCVYGFAARAVLKQYAANNADRLKSIQARFSHHVFPGETLETEMWQESDTAIYFRSRVPERDEVVLSNGVVSLHRIQSA